MLAKSFAASKLLKFSCFIYEVALKFSNYSFAIFLLLVFRVFIPAKPSKRWGSFRTLPPFFCLWGLIGIWIGWIPVVGTKDLKTTNRLANKRFANLSLNSFHNLTEKKLLSSMRRVHHSVISTHSKIQSVAIANNSSFVVLTTNVSFLAVAAVETHRSVCRVR